MNCKHYSSNLPKETFQSRFQSPLYDLRNANNLVKKHQISNVFQDLIHTNSNLSSSSQVLNKTQQQPNSNSLVILDVACGQGGDLFKFHALAQNANKVVERANDKVVERANDKVGENASDKVACYYHGFDSSNSSIEEAKLRASGLVNSPLHFTFAVYDIDKFDNQIITSSARGAVTSAPSGNAFVAKCDASAISGAKQLCLVNMQMCVHYFFDKLDIFLCRLKQVALPKSRVVISCLSWPYIYKTLKFNKFDKNDSNDKKREWKNAICKVQLFDDKPYCNFQLGDRVNDQEYILDDKQLIDMFFKYGFRLIKNSMFSDVIKTINPSLAKNMDSSQWQVLKMYQCFDFELES